ncbi:MAG: phosphotransferase family protein [Brevibacterium yomogidense]|uniref:Putative phosphotransferase n=1 Tax=Brevibacterium yomogidense TaxID=946573 RepID=A0A1X6XQ35_9MICO|nr:MULTISPECIES: phosphotransferase family protein [Brevibacterium]SLN01322.1 putative phosphotransferase [Brevibacterium yomogidense]SMX88072.1 Predicted kinase, aminoglycoside phosphotransferase (APT) family [Brevibacterium sp. Mu109]
MSVDHSRAESASSGASAAAAHAEQAGIELPALESWLQTQLGAGELHDPEFLTGGTQNVLLGFTWNDERLIYRGPPVNKRKNSDTIMLREARVLEALGGSGVPHPEFIAACEDLDVLGNAFFIMRAVDGFNGVSEIPAHVLDSREWQHEMGLSHARAVAQLGNVDHEAAGLEGFGRPDGWLARQPGRWVGQLESYRDFDQWEGLDHRGVEVIPAWLNERMPTEQRAGIIHGDCHAGNVLFRNDSPEVAALVDWELCTLGDPLLDLGHLLASAHGVELPGAPSKAETVAAYGDVSRWAVDDVDFYHVLACFRFGSILEGSQARASAGLVPESVGTRLHERTVSLFDQAMEIIES